LETEVLCTLITVAGTVLSALIAWFVSRSTASKELEKLKLTWEREDIVSSDDEFAAMASAVANYVHSNVPLCQREAMCAVASIRSKESGDLGTLLDQLYNAINSNYSIEADRLLSQVINKKRDAKGKRIAAD